MTKFLHKINKHENYIKNITEDHQVNITLCEDEYHLHYDKYIPPETRVIAKFNVTDISSPTQIISEDADSPIFSIIEIDGVAQPSVVNAYTFSTTGEHIIKYTLVDPTSIGDYAFYDCSSLTSITIPNNVTSIGEYAFRYCSGLTSVNILDLTAWCNIKFVDNFSNPLYYANHLYINDKEITNLVIPNNIISIGDYAFCGCSYLTSIVIPNSVTSIGWNAFQNCTSLTSVNISDLAAWCNIKFSSGYSTPLIIAHHLYINGDKITNLVIPNSITSIGDFAFDGCTDLISVTIPNSVISIGGSTFSGCTGLTSFTIPDSVTSIGDYVFSYCRNMTSITISNSVTSIGSCAFIDCSGLTSITIPNNLITINSAVFSGCNSLTSITIPNSVTSITDNAFYNCSSLTSVTISNNVRYIGKEAFSGCTNITSINIPNKVTYIGNEVFRGCSSLNSIVVESDNQKYDSRNNCNAIIETSSNTLITGCQNTIIPNSVISIGNHAFDGCTGLTSITIPDSVTSIGMYTFSSCSSLTSVTISNSVTSIARNAFSDCSSLTSIISNVMTAPTIQNNTFQNINKGGTLTVPSGSTGYDVWMKTSNYYLGKYNWTKVEQ